VGILAEDVAAVRAATDFVAIASERMSLKKVGRRWTGLCPFHAEKSPSFSVNAEEKLFHCLAGETRLLTAEGVRQIRDLAGTTQRILTENSVWVDAPISSFGVQPLMKITLGRNGQTKEIFATPEHRWILRDRNRTRVERTTAELRPGLSLSCVFPRNRTRTLRDLSPFGIAHGITFGDGTRFGPATALDLHGGKDAELLEWFPLSQRYAELKSHTGKPFTKVLDLPNFFKRPPSLGEASTYLAGWLAGYLAADGHVSKDGTVMLNAAKRENLQLVRDVCTRLGIGTYGITSQMRIGTGTDATELFRVHLVTEDLDDRFFLIDEHRRRFNTCGKKFSRRRWVVKSVETTDRVEEVFCATVEGTHSFVLEDNILTGNCFGCQMSGDVITFVRETEHLDFVGAVERLAAKANIQLRYDDAKAGPDRAKRDALYSAMNNAVGWYHDQLLTNQGARPARDYLRERGYNSDIARQFMIGWAPDDWDQLARHLKLTDKELTDTGLGFVNRRGKQQDAFRGRIMFPIYDTSGRAVAFGGRVLPGSDDPAKYKNSSETPIYSKRRVLYGLNWAKDDAVKSNEVVVCEGYTDVIAFYLAGAPRAVATCGTAVTEEHLRVLRTFAPRIVLAYDADAAGQAAAERFYTWERDLDLSLAVLALPKGADPADLARRDPDALREALAGAKSFLDFRVQRTLDAGNLRTPEGRAKTAEAALAMVAEHPNALVREQYIGTIAAAVDISPDQLTRSITQRGNKVTVAPVAPRRPARRGAGPETEALKVAIHTPEAVAGKLHEVLFTDPAHRDAFAALASGEPLIDAIAAAPPEAAELLQRLAVEDTDADPDDVLAGLARVAAGAAVDRLNRRAQEGGDPTSLAPTIGWLKQTREQLGDDDLRSEATEALVAWLAQEAEGGEGTT
jgi:DNA primase